MKYERKFERKSAFVLACAWVGERRKQYSNLIFFNYFEQWNSSETYCKFFINIDP